MIHQMDQGAGGDADLRGDVNSADRLMSPRPVVEEALQPVQRERTAVRSAPKALHIADVRALDAYIERRRKLAAKIRLENPSRTEEEFEARLEQFGA
jgi:hypothetical protein